MIPYCLTQEDNAPFVRMPYRTFPIRKQEKRDIVKVKFKKFPYCTRLWNKMLIFAPSKYCIL